MVEGFKRTLPDGCLPELRDLEAAEAYHAELKACADLMTSDGEHASVATLSDVVSLHAIVSQNVLISFHDANLVAEAIRNLERFFTYHGIKFATVVFPDCVSAIGLRGMIDTHRTTREFNRSLCMLK